jgi:hypothetical protein
MGIGYTSLAGVQPKRIGTGQQGRASADRKLYE